MQAARKIIIGGNWKSHNTLKDSQNLITNVINTLKFDAAKLGKENLLFKRGNTPYIINRGCRGSSFFAYSLGSGECS